MKNILVTLFKFFNFPIIKFIILPLILLFIGVFCSLFFNSSQSFSVISYGENNSSITYGKQLLKNQTVQGEFKAKDNYLGIVTIRFQEYTHVSYAGEDVLLFKLKEKGKNEWYYVNTYRTGILNNALLYPFGFPVISDSQGKTYIFSITSLDGNSTNAVVISNRMPNITTSYQFPKMVYASSKKNFIEFLIKKIIVSSESIDYLLSTSIFYLPIVFYFFLVFIMKYVIRIKNRIIILVVLWLILFDTFWIHDTYVGVLIGLSILWIILVKIYRFKSYVSFSIGVTFFLINTILLTFNVRLQESKLSYWIYLIFVIGVIQFLFETKKEQDKKV